MEPGGVTTVPGSGQTLPAGDPLAALRDPRMGRLPDNRNSALIAAYTTAVTSNRATPEQAVATLLRGFTNPRERMQAMAGLAHHLARLEANPEKAAEAQALRTALTAAMQPPADAQPAAPARRTQRPARTDNRQQPQQPQQNPQAQQPQQAGGLLGFFGGIFKAIGDFFAKLFGGGRPQQVENGGQQPVRGNQPQPQ